MLFKSEVDFWYYIVIGFIVFVMVISLAAQQSMLGS